MDGSVMDCFFGGRGDVATCGDFQLSLVVNSTHDFVIFLLASSLRKICSQDGRASNSEQASRHLLCSYVDTII